MSRGRPLVRHNFPRLALGSPLSFHVANGGNEAAAEG